jgi:hypothetical protein
MLPRQIALVVAVAFAFALFAAFAASSPYWTKGDVVGLSVFGLSFTCLVFVSLAVRRNMPVQNHHGLPRSFWVVFASLASAFASEMLLSIAAMPWVGYKGFDFFFGASSWWALAVLAAVAFPFVRKRLL